MIDPMFVHEHFDTLFLLPSGVGAENLLQPFLESHIGVFLEVELQ